MTIEAMLQRIETERVQLSAYHMMAFGFSGNKTPWTVRLEKKAEGVMLQAEAEAAHFPEALTTAFNKFFRVIEKGVPELVGPLIEAPKHTADDDIPF